MLWRESALDRFDFRGRIPGGTDSLKDSAIAGPDARRAAPAASSAHRSGSRAATRSHGRISTARRCRSGGDRARQSLYGVNCNFCHGSDARGGEGGPNLLRSELVLNDQNGE